MSMLILKQKSTLSYDAFIEDFKTRDSAILEIGFTNKIPSASCIKRFAIRIGCKLIDKMVGSCINLTRKKKLNVGIDSTGYHLQDGSHHYRKRLGEAFKTRKNIKLSIAVDTDKQLITAAKVRKSNAHDTKDFVPLVNKSKKIKPIRKSVGDKAYDAEWIHKFAEQEGFYHIAPLKNEVPVWRTKGEHRKKLRINFPEKEYHQRSKVETVNSVMKRIFGEVIRAKKWIMQKQEMLLKCLAYNIHRLVKIKRM